MNFNQLFSLEIPSTNTQKTQFNNLVNCQDQAFATGF